MVLFLAIAVGILIGSLMIAGVSLVATLIGRCLGIM